MSKTQGKEPADARRLAALALAEALEQGDELTPIDPDVSMLSEPDRRLARLIIRHSIQRKLSLQCLLDHFLKQPLVELEINMQAILLTGAAQLILMDRLPSYAVVDRSVALAKLIVRPGAGGMVNAVLRKVAGLKQDIESADWNPAADALPLEQGVLRLSQDVLPNPDDHAAHISQAFSIPRPLLDRWLHVFSEQETLRFCQHALCIPPILIATGSDNPKSLANLPMGLIPHDDANTAVYQADQDATPLTDILSAHPTWRVQDPTSAAAMGILQNHTDLTKAIQTALDLCAGKGTKTAQLADLLPHAKITSTDLHVVRRSTLIEAMANRSNVSVTSYNHALVGPYDFIVLDVPCTNTGVLARRPEARYRFTKKNLQTIVQLQREIIEQAIKAMSPGCLLLYATCSIEPDENQHQIQRLIDRHQAELIDQKVSLPDGPEPSQWRDGGYVALLRWK